MNHLLLSLLLCTYWQSCVADEYCLQVQVSGATDCHTCVEVTVLGGRPNCAYCSKPYTNMAYCQNPFYPPAVDIPGFTPYACYNDSGSTVAPSLRYRPRCAERDCYIDQCLISGLVLWYVIVPSVVGSLLLLVGCGCWCWCRQRNKASRAAWLAKDEKDTAKANQKLDMRSSARKTERERKANDMRKKYGLDSDDEESVI